MDCLPKRKNRPGQGRPKTIGGSVTRQVEGIDWEIFFLRWVLSGLSVEEFLVANGLVLRGHPIPKLIYGQVKQWAAKKQNMSQEDLKRAAIETMPIPYESQQMAEQPADAWREIAKFRRAQALQDYRSAESLRAHTKIILARSFKPGVDGGKPESTLSAHDAHKLAQVLQAVQRIQRLSLGLSTENVGIDDPAALAQTHVEKNVTPQDEPIPTFEVVMSKRGKFMTPRPRRIG
jgi:hypothetical protein